MRAVVLLLAGLVAGPLGAQEVADCGAATPAVTALVEPWEETTRSLGAGAIRLALLHRAQDDGVSLLVLTLPPPAVGEEALPADPLAPVERRCRLVAEGGLGFADLDLAAAEVTEDPATGTLTARLPALRFVPESTELEELALVLTFGVADDALAAEIEVGTAEAP